MTIAKVFSAGPEVKNTTIADALKNFQLGMSSTKKTRKPRPAKRNGSTPVSNVEAPVVASSPADIPSNEPVVVPDAKKDHSDQHKERMHHASPPQGNVSINQLFQSHQGSLSFLRRLQEKKEKMVCVFFHQGKRPSGGVVRSYLSLRIIMRPGSRIALCVIPGGTGWIATRFPVGIEFFLDELLGHREAPEERVAATRALRVIVDEVLMAKLEVKKARKVGSR